MMMFRSVLGLALLACFFATGHAVGRGRHAVGKVDTSELDKQIAATPPPANLGVTQVLGLARKLRVAMPCCGIDGCGRAFEILGVQIEAVNVFDLKSGYYTCLSNHFKEMGMDKFVLNLGKDAGNLLLKSLGSLETPVDILCAGPPCPPWSACGKRKSTSDPRSKVFFRILTWVVFFIKTAGLLCCVLENVVGILQHNNGREPVAYQFLRLLREHCPEFSWKIVVLKAKEYLLAHTRVRVFIIGLRKLVLADVPEPLPPFGARCLKDSLAQWPCTPRL
jgi:site-specific DNA-cytosine methylase